MDYKDEKVFNIEDVYEEILSAREVRKVEDIYRKYINEAKLSGNEQNLIDACGARKGYILNKQQAAFAR